MYFLVEENTMLRQYKIGLVSSFFLLCFFGVFVHAAVWPSGREAVELQASPFDLRDVRLLDGPFRDAMLRTQKYLHELESDRLLWYFRKTAGLETPGEPMGGWEKTELRGHTMGHYLSACALMYAGTSDEKLKAKADAIVVELAKCQKAIGTGYLSAYPEEQIDRVIALKPVWAPWYTLHKIFAGLIDMSVYCGNDQALDVAGGMASWAKSRLDPLNRNAMQEMLNRTEQGGMNETLANLYGITGDKQWLELAGRFNADAYNNPLILHRDELTGQHVNSFIPNVVGTARQYELTDESTDRYIAEFFWNCVVHGRTYCTGGTSVDEHWKSPPYCLADQLGGKTQENCCTYNMLKLTRHLFAWQPRAEYFDYYERNLINSILATQDPQTGMMTYFVTMASGCWKYFNTPRDSFWCCTGTGMENHAKYGDSIYFHNRDTLWVNLVIASELDWKQQDVVIRQETNFPEGETTTLTVKTSRPTEFDLRFRVPYWAGSGVTLKINSEQQQVTAQPASFLSIRRTWNDGDRIEMTMPMSLWLCPMPDDANLAAVMYGPMVLAGQLGEVDVPREMIYTLNNWFAYPEEHLVEAPVMVIAKRDPASWIKPVKGRPLTFRTIGVGRPNDVTLVPYHRLWNQKYAIYWRLMNDAGFRQLEIERKARQQAKARDAARKASLNKRKIDSVDIGVSDSEQSHEMKGHATRSGDLNGRNWRDAGPGGWFEYRLKVLPDMPVKLWCTYWGSDGGRTFDILVDNMQIATQKLNDNRPGVFFDVVYDIPVELTRDKTSVVVRFTGHQESIAGGVFGLATVKSEP
jgi:DUF1680 family protein